MNKTKLLLTKSGNPRLINVYDNNGQTADRYTVCFTTTDELDYTPDTLDQFWYLTMSYNPFNPCGIGMHGESNYPIDSDGEDYDHLGKKIRYQDLPDDCKKLVLSDYVYLWDLKDHPAYYEH
jgi:hypothetical protein